MPSKARWALNPKKWFHTLANPPQKRDRHDDAMPQTHPTGITIIRTASMTPNMVRLSRTKSRSKVAPLLIPNDINENNTMNYAPVTQLQLPSFSVRRERTSLSIPFGSLNRQNTVLANYTEPTIRRNGRCEDKLAINTKRSPMPPISTTISDSLKKDHVQPTNAMHQMEMSLFNMSRRCLVDYPRHSPMPIPIPELSLTRRFSTASSLIDDNDQSSDSEVLNDEQQQYNERKNGLLISDVVSVKSLADSQTSLDRFHSRPIIHYYGIPIHVSERTTADQHREETPATSLSHSHDVEDNQTNLPSKRSQSSVAMMKKIEKCIRTSQSPIVPLDKPEFIRVTNASYRLTADKSKHSSEYHKNAIDSFVGCTNSDDSLRPAKDEECYATLPRGSSTERINKNMHNDLRSIVDGYLRPMVTSIGSNRLPKTHHQHRAKRAHVNDNHTQLIIEDITDKLLSSIDYSIYTQHQRCF